MPGVLLFSCEWEEENLNRHQRRSGGINSLWMADDLDAAPLDNNNTMKKVGVRNWVCIVRSFLVYDSSVGRFLLLLSSQTSTSPGLGPTSTILYNQGSQNQVSQIRSSLCYSFCVTLLHAVPSGDRRVFKRNSRKGREKGLSNNKNTIEYSTVQEQEGKGRGNKCDRNHLIISIFIASAWIVFHFVFFLLLFSATARSRTIELMDRLHETPTGRFRIQLPTITNSRLFLSSFFCRGRL